MSEPWYPSEYYLQPHFDSYPTINFWDTESFRRRRRKYWNAAWTRALQRWHPVGLNLVYHPGPVSCTVPGVTVEVLDVPQGIGAWAYPHPAPNCGFVQVDITTWREALASRNIGHLTEVITHEVGHILGFGDYVTPDGSGGIMSWDPGKLPSPNAEEIAAARAYWGVP